jgi:hypothetical protein
MPVSPIRKVWRLPVAEALRGQRALWWSVGPDGALAVLLVHRRYLTRRRYPRGWVGWRVRTPFSGELVVLRGNGEHRTTVRDIRERPSHLAVLPASRFLLAAGRTFRDGAGEAWPPNATVFSAAGTPEAEFGVGDDIDVLVTDRDGRIWTAYGDEGIYGGHPASVHGLAGWSMDGRPAWFPGDRLPAYPLAGLTGATEGEHVWLVWCSGSGRGTFLTRVTPTTGDVISYPSPVRSPDGFAVRGDRAVFTRRRHNRRSTELVHAELKGGEWRVTGRRRLRVPGRVVLRCAQGRDGSLWLRAGDTWLRIEA